MHRMNCIATVSVVMLAAAASHAAVIAGWEMNGLTGYGSSPFAAGTVGSNVTVGGLTRGAGVNTGGTAANNAWGAQGWDQANAANAISTGDVATFNVTTTSGFTTSFSSFSAFNLRRSGTGPSTSELQYQVGAGAFSTISTLSLPTTTSAGNSIGSINLAGIGALQNVAAGTAVTFRFVNYGGTGGTWYIQDPSASAGNDFVLNGTTSAVNVNPVVTVTPPSVTLDVSPPGLESFAGVTVSATDSDGTVTSLVAGTIPAQIADNITIGGSGAGPLSVSGSGFTYGDLGTYIIPFTATDNLGGTHAQNFTLNVVPEPTTLVAIAGLGLLGLRRRRSV